MEHKWIKDKGFEPHHEPMCGFVEDQSTCATCGCKRGTVSSGYDSPHTLYERSGVFFGIEMPECLDWNDNTLD